MGAKEDIMFAARIHRFGAPEVIEIEEVPRPEPGPKEVLVRVLAAGVGPWDAWVRSGKSRIDQPLPLTLGSDIAGRVEAVGDAVRGFNPGDMVYGVTNERFTGGYAEYASASADSIAPSPARLGAVDAASVPVVAVTAQQMLFEHGHLGAGQRVLVHGAGGSVGAYAVQLAKAAGAEVVGTDRGGGFDYARSLAPHMVDATADDFAALGPFDLVVDTVGGDGLQHRSMAALETGGRLISSVNKPDEEVAKRMAWTRASYSYTSRALHCRRSLACSSRALS